MSDTVVVTQRIIKEENIPYVQAEPQEIVIVIKTDGSYAFGVGNADGSISLLDSEVPQGVYDGLISQTEKDKLANLKSLAYKDVIALDGDVSGTLPSEYASEELKNANVNETFIMGAMTWSEKPTSGATKNTGALANQDTVNLSSQVTGTLGTANADSGLKNSSITIGSNGILSGGGGGQVTIGGLGYSGSLNATAGGLTFGGKKNYTSFTAYNEGEIYFCGYDKDGNLADIDGSITVNGNKVAMVKDFLNPNMACSGYIIYNASAPFSGRKYAIGRPKSTNSYSWEYYDTALGTTAITLDTTTYVVGTAVASGSEMIESFTVWQHGAIPNQVPLYDADKTDYSAITSEISTAKSEAISTASSDATTKSATAEANAKELASAGLQSRMYLGYGTAVGGASITYPSSNEVALSYTNDSNTGMCSYAINVEAGKPIDFSFECKCSSSNASSGFYCRVQEYYYDLPAGKLAISGSLISGADSRVVLKSNQITSFRENASITTTYTTYNFTYTPTAGAKWASVEFLNWDGMGTRTLYIRNLKWGIELSANHIKSGTLTSENWSTSAGSQFDLNGGTFMLGGSSSPKLSWDGSTLGIEGSMANFSGNPLLVNSSIKTTSTQNSSLDVSDIEEDERITSYRWFDAFGITGWQLTNAIGITTLGDYVRANDVGSTTYGYFSSMSRVDNNTVISYSDYSAYFNGSIKISMPTGGYTTISAGNITTSRGDLPFGCTFEHDGSITATGTITAPTFSGTATNSELLDGYDSTVFLKRNSTLESNLDTKYDSDLFGWSSSTVGRPEGYGQGISIVSSGTTYNGSSNWITQLGFGTSGNQGYFRTKVNAGSWSDWHKLWHSGNDGSGSGLDADKLDGVHASQFLRSDADDTFTSLSGTSLTIGSGVTLAESSDRADLLQITSSTSTWAGLQIKNTSNEGRWSFMTDGEVAGIYNDEDNQWHIYMAENSYTQIYYANSAKLKTTSTGVQVYGSVYCSGYSYDWGATNPHGYTNIGNGVYLQWGVIDGAVTTGTVVTFPLAFTGIMNVQCTGAGNNYLYADATILYDTVSTTGFTLMTHQSYNTRSYWFAIGKI